MPTFSNVSPVTRKVMQANKGKDTKPEMVVRRFLHAQGLRYRLHRKGLPGRPDVVFPSRKLALFVHGCFWHGCEKCRSGQRVVKANAGYWTAKRLRNRERDTRTAAQLDALGWRTVTVWECEIKGGAALPSIAEQIRAHPSSGRPSRTAPRVGPL